MKLSVKLQSKIMVIEFYNALNHMFVTNKFKLQPIQYINVKYLIEQLLIICVTKKEKKTYTLQIDVNHYEAMRILHEIDSNLLLKQEHAYKFFVVTHVLENAKKELDRFVSLEANELTKAYK